MKIILDKLDTGLKIRYSRWYCFHSGRPDHTKNPRHHSTRRLIIKRKMRKKSLNRHIQ